MVSEFISYFWIVRVKGKEPCHAFSSTLRPSLEWVCLWLASIVVILWELNFNVYFYHQNIKWYKSSCLLTISCISETMPGPGPMYLLYYFKHVTDNYDPVYKETEAQRGRNLARSYVPHLTAVLMFFAWYHTALASYIFPKVKFVFIYLFIIYRLEGASSNMVTWCIIFFKYPGIFKSLYIYSLRTQLHRLLTFHSLLHFASYIHGFKFFFSFIFKYKAQCFLDIQ